MKTVIAVNQDRMGHGDPELGRRILATFLKKSIAIRDLDAVVFYNSGVQLLAEGSPVLAELAGLEHRGVDLLPCGTCVQHYGVALAVAETSTMEAIVAALDKAEKVITL